jgi:NAD(P)-dependent dehydrogenase (short-subunit alcohol dehydrogenase family)
MEINMTGKVVMVTGANGGLGASVTRALLEAGATVVGVSRHIAQSDFSHAGFTALAGEISTAEGAKNAVEAIVTRLGKLDVVVHTVGGFAGGPSIVDTDDATFQRMLDMNLNSAFYILARSFRTCGGLAVAG